MSGCVPNSKKDWTEQEIETLRRLYPRCETPAELYAAFPNRTASAIRYKAVALGIKCEHRQHVAKQVSPIEVRDGMSGRVCTVCKEWKPIEKFTRHATCAGGRRNICTTCEGRVAYKKHRDKCLRAVRTYQANHPLKVSAIKRAYDQSRRVRLANGRGVTTAELRELIDQYDGRCAYCGENVADTIDHVIPLSRGGLHQIDNLLPACRSCNSHKHTKTLKEWCAVRIAKEL